MCQVSCDMCQMTGGTCQCNMSHDTYRMTRSSVKCYMTCEIGKFIAGDVSNDLYLLLFTLLSLKTKNLK